MLPMLIAGIILLVLLNREKAQHSRAGALVLRFLFLTTEIPQTGFVFGCWKSALFRKGRFFVCRPAIGGGLDRQAAEINGKLQLLPLNAGRLFKHGAKFPHARERAA
ncbi:MAG TPA: hypothetical protein IAB66_06045 [Candidatus Caccousia avistercoris]|nr:hypothetical protein [Candidatus Caccousia avistercoris]